MSKKILITCGGTGGHLAPGIALAEGLTARGHAVILFISQKRVDARLIEKYPHFNFVPVPGTAFAWHPLGLVRFLASQARGFIFSLRAMRQIRPDVMVGFGGFTSVSAVIAGRMLRIPVALHEANRVPGRTVCLLGRLVQRVYLPQGVRLSSVRASATRHVSLPVRREISRQPRAAALERLALDPTQRVLVVFGGSQGAAALNDWARSQLDRLAHAGIQVYGVTGLGKGRHEVLQLSTQAYAPIRAVFTPFCDDVAGLLSAADLVVARAGAGTIAELIRCTTPAILVPYPHAASDHQRANAAFFEKQGGGVVVDQIFLPTLHAEVLDVIFNDWLLHKFRTNLAHMDHAASFDLLLDASFDLLLDGHPAARGMMAAKCQIPKDQIPEKQAADSKICVYLRSSAVKNNQEIQVEMRPVPPPSLFSRDVRSIHCVGVGGMGVGPLAVYLAQLGFEVTGEDDALVEPMRALLTREHVAVVPSGTVPAGCQLVVYSSAIAAAHPARLAAVARGLPLVRRGELLAEVMRGKKLVAVCGAHGKTTTTAMLITALRRARFPAGWVLGGLFADDAMPPARTGSSDWVVAEIDESDGTIDAFSPEITLATNLDWDHPDHYRRLDDFATAFAALFARTKSAVLTSDACALSQRLAAAAQPGSPLPQFFSFGRSGDFSCEIAGETGEHLRLRLGGRFPISEAQVRARGEFNAANAAAALAAAQLMGAGLAPRLLADYAGVCRRQSVIHAAPGLTVIEDYAHHPAEIRALLASLRGRVGERGRLIVLFQPHRFSRTAQFKTEFAAALALADRVHLLDVYAAGEAPLAGGTTADIYAELKKNSAALPVDYLPGDDAALFRALSRELQRGDLVAFVGAGDIDQKARVWLELRRADEMKAKIWDDFAAALRPPLSATTRLVREESLAAKTTMRVGGAARVYAEPATVADLQVLLCEAHARGVEVFFLGRGSNLIVPDEGVDGLVVALSHEAWQRFEPRPDGRVWAGAGLRLKNLCGLAGKAGLVGFEFLEGIPGSVGGALRMNAGAMGGWMFDVVEEVEIMTPAGEVKTLRKADMHVAYRHCAELLDAIALGVLLRPAAQADTEAISRQIDVYRRKRHETQPREPSAGCIFKNPAGNSAGRLIDEAGLKGERVGDAEVSTVHANFIINRGHATGSDVIALMRRVRARVREARGVELEPEVLLYGKKWEEVL